MPAMKCLMSFLVIFLNLVITSIHSLQLKLGNEDNTCQELCKKYEIVPSLWDGCRGSMSNSDRSTWNSNECAGRLSQSCKLWSSLLSQDPRPVVDWDATCRATFGGIDTLDEMVLLTVANRPSGMFGLLLKSVLSKNIKTVVVGWDFWDNKNDNHKQKKTKHGKYYSGYKVISLYLLLKTCVSKNLVKDDLYIMFVDGTDSVFQQGPDYILSHARRIDAPIIFSTERDMFPATEHIKSIYPRSYKAPIKTIFGHLNTGGWIGKPQALLEWYREWANAPYVSYTKPVGKKKLVLDRPQPVKSYKSVEELWNKRNVEATSPELPRVFRVGDQFNAAHMYLDDVANATVDSFASLFISMWIPAREQNKFFQFENLNKKNEDEDYAPLKSLRTKSRPAVMHYNGPAKLQYCGDRGATTVFSNSHYTKDKVEKAIQDGKLVFLNADLALLKKGVVSAALVEASYTERVMKCKGQC